MRYLYLLTILFFASHLKAASPQVHYIVEPPKSMEQAIEMLQEATLQSEVALKEDDMHELHEISYRLEAAVAYINTQMQMVAEEVEVMHKASEHKDSEKAQGAYNAFAPTVQALSK